MLDESPPQRTLDSRVTAVEGRLLSIEGSLQKIEKHLEQDSNKGRLNLTHVGVIVAILLGVGGVGVSYIGQVVRPLEQKAAESSQDRLELRKLAYDNQSGINELKAADKEFAAKAQEIETQFRGEDQYRNVQQANNLRYIALLWQRTYGEHFPDAIQFYPQITQPQK